MPSSSSVRMVSPRFCAGCGNQVDNHLIASQGPPSPVLRDPGKHAMLDAIPLAGARREMAN